MMRQRRGGAPSDDESSSDEEDAFAALSRKKKEGGGKKVEVASSRSQQVCSTNQADIGNATATATLPVSVTSSMKRHHVPNNDTRKAKMDALLLELEAEKSRRPPVNQQDRGRGFVPEKKGSFVDPEEEHLTTNIFVGNLAPSITEEEMTDLFRQFGDLYSVKIMWPRTPEERARNRNTGFVCFMKREDAEEAMDACSEADPFNVGRRLMLRWGKNVKKSIKRGTGGVAIAPIRKRAAVKPSMLSTINTESDSNKRPRTDSSPQVQTNNSPATSNKASVLNPFSATVVYDPDVHGKGAIRVKLPQSPVRAQFIATVASFIAKDGSVLESKLIELERSNPDFAFLAVQPEDQIAAAAGDEQKQLLMVEHVFYRWRVFAFCQGDGWNAWRTEPFMMIRPNGRFWIPPSLNREAARQEEHERKMHEESIERQKKQRRRLLTGRQLEQSRVRRGLKGSGDGAKLSHAELDQFNLLVRKKLCAARDAICEAMAFCFEKSSAAEEVAKLLKDSLLEDENICPGISVETRVARLYLLSDVLFNSQQPGVRNAFKYRDAIERMSPEVFASLGMHGRGTIGRMTWNKLSNAVSSVLAAWTNWCVYPPVFMDELQAHFEGREIKKEAVGEEEEVEEEPDEVQDVNNENAVKIITETQRRDWTEVIDDPEDQPARNIAKEASRDSADATAKEQVLTGSDKEKTNDDKEVSQPGHDEDDLDGEALDGDDLDGEALDEDDLDGEALDEGDIDGEAMDDNDLDGEALDVDDLDGEAASEVGIA